MLIVSYRASAAVIIRIPWVKTFAQIDDFLYATVNIALWSNIETGLGITAGSLATLRPLLRPFLSSRRGETYSPTPGPSAPRVALGSLESSTQGRFRPDKLAVTVTTVQGDAAHEDSDSWERTSLEQLTDRPPLPGVAEEMGLGMGIHRTVEVTQTGEYV